MCSICRIHHSKKFICKKSMPNCLMRTRLSNLNLINYFLLINLNTELDSSKISTLINYIKNIKCLFCNIFRLSLYYEIFQWKEDTWTIMITRRQQITEICTMGINGTIGSDPGFYSNKVGHEWGDITFQYGCIAPYDVFRYYFCLVVLVYHWKENTFLS